jgi:hypothetical protein
MGVPSVPENVTILVLEVAVDHPQEVRVIERLRDLCVDPQPIAQEQVSLTVHEAQSVHLLHD